MLLGLHYYWKATLQPGYSLSDGPCKRFHGKQCKTGSGKLLSLLIMPIMLGMLLHLARSMAVCLGTLLPSIAASCNAQP